MDESDTRGDSEQAKDCAIKLLARAEEAMARHRGNDALRYLRGAVSSSPSDHDIVRAAGELACKGGYHHEAMKWLRQALSLHPEDADGRVWLGNALSQYGDVEQAVVELRRACSLAPRSHFAWFSLGDTARVACHVDEARHALNRALQCELGQWRARVSLATLESSVGNIERAASLLRAVLKDDDCNAAAWLALANLKTIPIDAQECDVMARVYGRMNTADETRARLGFALAKALEDQDRHEQAFDVLSDANAMFRKQVQWDAAALRSTVDTVQRTFHTPHPARCDDQLGHGAVFLASVPRSGSSLVEQILASHPAVAAAGERDDLMRLVDTQSRRLDRSFPDWVPRMGPARWRRMGAAYLERNARWRQRQPCFVDKGMTNWLLVGVILSMLPHARVVICRRDPLETCLGCFRQFFTQGAAFTYDLDEMVDYYAGFDRLGRFWKRMYPDQVLVLKYENLVQEPERKIRELLAFCHLPYDAACLRPHETTRVVLNTPSAAQVRQPMHSGTARADRYGRKLDPLRRRLVSAGLA